MGKDKQEMANELKLQYEARMLEHVMKGLWFFCFCFSILCT